MADPASKQRNPVKRAFAGIGPRFFRLGTVFSAVMVVLSLFSSLGTQLVNRFGAGGGETSADKGNNTPLPYETPSYRLIESVFVPDAKASFVNIALGGLALG